jgi:hypothetical protein
MTPKKIHVIAPKKSDTKKEKAKKVKPKAIRKKRNEFGDNDSL